MQQEHIQAIQLLVGEYCHRKSLMAIGQRLHVELRIEQIETVKVSVLNEELEQAYEEDVSKCFARWCKVCGKSRIMPKTGRTMAGNALDSAIYKSGMTIKDFCSLNESQLLRYRRVGKNILEVYRVFLSWVHPDLSIGCTEHFHTFER